MSRTTWTMVHMLGDRLIEEWMGHRIRDLSRHYIINILWILNFVLLIQKDKKMYVRQSPLLKFNSINHASHFTKQTAPDIFEKLFHLLNKNTCHNVRPIRGLLSFTLWSWIFQKGICDFRPIWICGH